MWCAAITSVVGASFTSVSFWKTLVPAVKRNEKIVISIFIIVATIIFLYLGNPVTLLILAGAVNGIILPVALAVILAAANNSMLMKQYKHPVVLQTIGWLVVIIMSYMGYITLTQNLRYFFNFL